MEEFQEIMEEMGEGLMPEEDLDLEEDDEYNDAQLENKEKTEEKDIETEEKIVGAVWVRIMEDYGHVEDGVPSFAYIRLGKMVGNAFKDGLVLKED